MTQAHGSSRPPPPQVPHKAFAGAGTSKATRQASLSPAGRLHHASDRSGRDITAEVYKTHMHLGRTPWQCIKTWNACPLFQLSPVGGSVLQRAGPGRVQGGVLSAVCWVLAAQKGRRGEGARDGGAGWGHRGRGRADKGQGSREVKKGKLQPHPGGGGMTESPELPPKPAPVRGVGGRA